MTQVKRRGDCIGAPRAVLPAGAVSTHFPACFRRPATAHRTVQRSRRRATWSMRPGDAGCTPCTRRATRAGSRRTQPDRSRAGPCLSVSNALRTRTDTSFETVWRIRVIRHLPNDGIPDPASAVVRAVQANPRRRDDRSREQGIWCCRLERNACSFACTGSRRARDAPVRSTMRGHARLRSHGTTCRQPPAASRQPPPTTGADGEAERHAAVAWWHPPAHRGEAARLRLPVRCCCMEERRASSRAVFGFIAPAPAPAPAPARRGAAQAGPRGECRAGSPLSHPRWRRQASARAAAGSGERGFTETRRQRTQSRRTVSAIASRRGRSRISTSRCLMCSSPSCSKRRSTRLTVSGACRR